LGRSTAVIIIRPSSSPPNLQLAGNLLSIEFKMATLLPEPVFRRHTLRHPTTENLTAGGCLPSQLQGKPPVASHPQAGPHRPAPTIPNQPSAMSDKSNILTKEWKAHLLAQADKLVANADAKPFRHSMVDSFLPADLLPLVYQ